MTNILGTPTCVQCRSTDVSIHGRSTWSDTGQQWVLQTADTGGVQCVRCGPTALRWSRGLQVADYEPTGKDDCETVMQQTTSDLWTVLIGGFIALILVAIAFALFARPAHSEGLRSDPGGEINLLCNFDMGVSFSFMASTGAINRSASKLGYINVQVGPSLVKDSSSIDGVLATSVTTGDSIIIDSSGIVKRQITVTNILTKGGKSVIAIYGERRRTGGIFTVLGAMGTCWKD